VQNTTTGKNAEKQPRARPTAFSEAGRSRALENVAHTSSQILILTALTQNFVG